MHRVLSWKFEWWPIKNLHEPPEFLYEPKHYRPLLLYMYKYKAFYQHQRSRDTEDFYGTERPKGKQSGVEWTGRNNGINVTYCLCSAVRTNRPTARQAQQCTAQRRLMWMSVERMKVTPLNQIRHQLVSATANKQSDSPTFDYRSIIVHLY